VRFSQSDASPTAAVDGFAGFLQSLTVFEVDSNPLPPQGILRAVRLLHKVAGQKFRGRLRFADAMGERQKKNGSIL